MNSKNRISKYERSPFANSAFAAKATSVKKTASEGKRTTNDECRGAALVLTLGILALITVLAVSFATLMRVEEKSARMALDLNKARLIAKAGLNHAVSILKKDLSDDQTANDLHDSLDEDWITTFSGTDQNLDNLGGNESKWIYIHEDPADNSSPVIGRYAVLIQDEAGKINLNVAGIDEDEGWSPSEIKLSEIPGIGTTLDDAIINYRQGENLVPGDDATGAFLGDDNDNNTPLEDDDINNDGDGSTDETDEGKDSPTEFNPDIPFSDDRSFSSVEELIKVGGIGSSIVAAAKNYATVWSYDINQFWNGANWARKVNINHLLSTGQLYNLIEASNVYRMAANMIDYADRDFYPTLTTSNAGSPDPTNTYIGLEGLQFNEVMTDVTPIERKQDDSTVSEAPWSDQVTYDQGNNGGATDVGSWSWPWDNGTYEIAVDQANGANILVDGQAASTDPTVYTQINISGNAIDLTIEDPTDFDGGSNPIFATFTKIYIRAGKYVEIVNISKLPVLQTTLSSMKLHFGSTLTQPTADGLPTKVSGGSFIELSAAQYYLKGSTQLNGASSITFDYLIIADSLYAIDEKYGDLDGSWTISDPGKLIVNEQLYSNLSSSGSNLVLTDSNNNVIAYAPTANSFNITGYGSSPSSDQAVSRTAPVNQSGAWNSVVTATPGANNFGMTIYSWETQDRPYASPGELGDVYLGTSNNGTYDVEVDGDEYFDKITVAAKRLEAEDANTPLPWASEEDATDHDGTKRRIAPNASASSDWNWTFNIADTTHLTKPFRLRNNEAFDVLVYGQFGVDFESPLGSTRQVKPNHGVSLTGPFTVTSNNISVPISGNGTIAPKLDFVVLTPDPYTWGKININTASEEALKGLPGIDTLADDIITYRVSNIFDQIQEVTSVSGIGEAIFKKISNLITVRSDVYRVLVKAERLVDLDGDGDEGDAGDQTVSSVSLEAVLDRNPDRRFPGTSDRYRIEFLKYTYEE